MARHACTSLHTTILETPAVGVSPYMTRMALNYAVRCFARGRDSKQLLLHVVQSAAGSQITPHFGSGGQRNRTLQLYRFLCTGYAFVR
jgi:hypothetical protein